MARATLSGHAKGTRAQNDAARFKCSPLTLINMILFTCGVLIMIQLKAHTHISSNGNTSQQAPGSTLRSPQQKEGNKNTQEAPKIPGQNLNKYKVISDSIKQQFYDRYGGKEFATNLLEKGIITFSKKDPKKNNNSSTGSGVESGIHHTMGRILLSIATSQPFVMAFGGYSVTVGRGNYFSQSFPFVLENILKSAMEELGVPSFEVRNGAIGGIPSFPYGWCLGNFLGEDISVVSWDFGMNEGKSAQGLEAYLRHTMTMLNHATSGSLEDRSTLPSPLFILLDTSRSRLDVLQKYVDHESIHDPIAIQSKGIGYDKYTSGQTQDRATQTDATIPVGFQDWTSWGAPKGSPGQSKWHPKYKEHELIGWMLAMHFLKAMDGARDIMQQSPLTWEHDIMGKWWEMASQEARLPPPINPKEATQHSLSSLLFGIHDEDNTSKLKPLHSWKMNPTHCRTTFQRIEQGSLVDHVVSGVSPSTLTQDILETRDEKRWTEGWVYDIGDLERKTKVKLQKFDNGLGYIDMKTAFYGIPSSGILKLFLPFHADQGLFDDDDATHITEVRKIKSLVICEVNEKRGDKECNLARDVTFVVGDRTVTAETITDAANYLSKPICVRVPIPDDVKVSQPPLMSMEHTEGGDGIMIELSVSRPDVTVKDGACSVSHVIWET